MRFLKWVLALCATLAVSVSALVGMVAWRAGAARVAEPSDCIIVLGARVHMSGRLSDSLRYRCESALDAYRAGLAGYIIASGGQGADEPMPEAEAMRDWFVKNGVPDGRVLVEPNSTDTWQNLEFSRDIMHARGWKSAVVVTSDYHLERSLWIARDLEISVTGIAAQSPKPFGVRWSNRLREAGSWGVYWLRRIF